MPEQIQQTDGTNLKVIKVGHYRMFFIFCSVAGLIFFGATMNGIIFSVTLGVLFGWVIFELNILLQAVMGVQRLLMYAMQPKQEVRQQLEEGKPAVKLIDINSGVQIEEKTPQK